MAHKVAVVLNRSIRFLPEIFRCVFICHKSIADICTIKVGNLNNGGLKMTHYQKHWIAMLQKKHQREIPNVISSPQKCVELKLRASATRLDSIFKEPEKLLHAEFVKPTWIHTDIPKEILVRELEQHVDSLWNNAVNDYVFRRVFQYMESERALYRRDTTQKKMRNIEENIANGIAEFMLDAIVQYYTAQKTVKDRICDMVEEANANISELCESLGKEIRSAWNRVENLSCHHQIQSMLNRLTQSGHSSYRYVCENSAETCNICANLNGQEFEIKDAVTGENLPPMHPNCRCSIVAANTDTIQDVSEWLSAQNIENITDAVLNLIASSLESTAQNNEVTKAVIRFFETWRFFLTTGLLDYYGSFTAIVVDGVEYRINRHSFTAVAMDSNENLIVPENASEYDVKMLALMKQRDMLPKESDEYAAVLAEIQALYDSTDRSLRKVDPKDSYDYYFLGGDITEQLNSYMQQTEVDYADMHNQHWVNNLLPFRRLVGNAAIMDLKNQPEWQHSACIYDGEIVDQDAMGNINYGFFGRHCNIPESVLIAGAGYAQISAGTSAWDFWITFGDDPRDCYRVIQGIDVYEQWH